MFLFYLTMIQAGHFYCIFVIVLVQFELFRELVNVRYVEAKEREMPLFRTLQWSWFLLAMIFVYGESLHNFCAEHPHLHRLTLITAYVHQISYVLYIAVFVTTVLTLKAGMYRFQLSQLMWTFLTIGMVVFQCKFLASNTLNGLFWYMFPMACVVNNDVTAYFCGITMGRKFINAPFLSLSPNKTWEGFMGAAVLTIIFGFFFPLLLARYTWFTCPVHDLYITELPPPLTCDVHDVFLPKDYTLPVWVSGVLAAAVRGGGAQVASKLMPLLSITLGESGLYVIRLLPIQLHGIMYGMFASFIAPFGGFLASGIKRAYKRKDFDAIFPGHGGMMDRMDCILIMIFFTSFHYRTFIETKLPTIGQIMRMVQHLPQADRVVLVAKIQELIAVGAAAIPPVGSSA